MIYERTMRGMQWIESRGRSINERTMRGMQWIESQAMSIHQRTRRGIRWIEESTKRGNSTTNENTARLHKRPSRDSVMRWCLILCSVAAITSSMLTIYSCKFFSYKELDVFNDAYTNPMDDGEPVVSYEPFEYLPKAGVGLFSYYMGDPTGRGVMMNDPMCFYYCDEYTDYQWLSSNTRGTGHGTIDLWVLSRVCSMFAPIVGGLALLQMLVEVFSGVRIGFCGNGTLLKAQIFLVATFFQMGTFLVVFAPPVMSSTSEADQQQKFCFSESSTVQCKMDTGSAFSLLSTLLYLWLAIISFYTRPSKPKVDGKSKCGVEPVTDESESDSDDNPDEGTVSVQCQGREDDDKSQKSRVAADAEDYSCSRGEAREDSSADDTERATDAACRSIDQPEGGDIHRERSVDPPAHNKTSEYTQKKGDEKTKTTIRYIGRGEGAQRDHSLVEMGLIRFVPFSTYSRSYFDKKQKKRNLQTVESLEQSIVQVATNLDVDDNSVYDRYYDGHVPGCNSWESC